MIRSVTLLVVLLLAASAVRGQDTVMAQQFILELNAMRANPASFISKIDSYVREWKSFVPDAKKFTREAEKLKKLLKTQKPLAPYIIDTNLAKAARDHAKDSRLMGVLGHIGSDGSTPLKRVQRYMQIETVSEIITYGQTTAAEMLAAFLVDHQTPDKGHRKTVLSTQLTNIGVTVDSHPKYRIQCVVVLGKSDAGH